MRSQRDLTLNKKSNMSAVYSNNNDISHAALSNQQKSQIAAAENGAAAIDHHYHQQQQQQRTPLCNVTAAATTTTTSLVSLVQQQQQIRSAIKNLNEFKTTTKMKFFVCLIILFGVVVRTTHALPTPTSGQRLIFHSNQYREQRYQQLLQEQRSLVLPTPHRHHMHHRSVRMEQPAGEDDCHSNGSSDVGSFCCAMQNAAERFKEARKQANTTYIIAKEGLENYIQLLEEKLTVEDFSERWEKHHLHLKHPYSEHLIRNYTIDELKPEQLHLANRILTYENLKEELQNINRTWLILNCIFEEVLESRRNASKEHGNMEKNHSAIDEILQKQKGEIGQNIGIAKDIIWKLNLTPTNEKIVLDYFHGVQQREWFLLMENLSVAKYFIALYDFLLSKCNDNSNGNETL